MEKYKVTKTQAAKIIGVNPKSLSRWDNKRIITELAKNCYKVMDIKKEGKSIYFYLEYEEYSVSNDEHLKEVFKVKDVKKLKNYTKKRVEYIENNKIITKKEICNETNTSIETSKRYDRKLIEKGVIEKLDDIIYICVDRTTRERVIVNKEAYNNFWQKNSFLKGELLLLEKRFLNNELSIDNYNYAKDMNISKCNSKYMYYKINKFMVRYDNYLYKMLVEKN